MAHPSAIAVGEVTRWPDAWRGDPELLRRLALARGGRVEGHTAGASAEKIAAIAAAGFTSDHEPITAQEVLDRARLGIAVMLRESSLRPDLVGLLDALKTAPALASRLMLTSDGSMPAFIRTHGFVDHLIRVARGPRRLRATRPRALPGHQAGQRGDQPTAGATDGAGRSPRGPPGSRRTLGRAGRRRGLRRAARRLRDHDQHRLQHPGTRSPAGGDGAGRQPAPRPSWRDRPRRRRPNRLRAPTAARGHHDAQHGRRGGRAGRRAAPAARRARLPTPRAALHAVLSCGGLSPGRAALAARRLGRQAAPDSSSVATPAPGQPVLAVTGSAPRRQRRLALGVLLAAAALAVAVFPIRGTWWGGWVLAIAEAGIVGGAARWLSVPGDFPRALRLPP